MSWFLFGRVARWRIESLNFPSVNFIPLVSNTNKVTANNISPTHRKLQPASHFLTTFKLRAVFDAVLLPWRQPPDWLWCLPDEVHANQYCQFKKYIITCNCNHSRLSVREQNMWSIAGSCRWLDLKVCLKVKLIKTTTNGLDELFRSRVG